MGTAERRLEILKYLCKFRKATMPHLAKIFGVSVRTVQRDVLEIEATFHVPLDVRCGWRTAQLRSHPSAQGRGRV